MSSGASVSCGHRTNPLGQRPQSGTRTSPAGCRRPPTTGLGGHLFYTAHVIFSLQPRKWRQPCGATSAGGATVVMFLQSVPSPGACGLCPLTQPGSVPAWSMLSGVLSVLRCMEQISCNNDIECQGQRLHSGDVPVAQVTKVWQHKCQSPAKTTQSPWPWLSAVETPGAACLDLSTWTM